MYIVEATPGRDVNNPGALDKKTIVYLDSEVWFEPYIDTYDQRGQLWRTHICWLAYRDRPVPDAFIAIYPFKREFVVGAARSTRKEVSLRSGLSTNAGTSIKAGSAKIFSRSGRWKQHRKQDDRGSWQAESSNTGRSGASRCARALEWRRWISGD
jgi:hypothetical protein